MPAMTNSKTVVLAVVLSLALAALAVIVGAVVLGAGGHVVPGELWTLAGTAIGAIAGLLARTSTEPDPTVPHATPILSTFEHTDPGGTSVPVHSQVTQFVTSDGMLVIPHDATFTAGTALAVDGTTVPAPKQPAKVAHARATRTAPPVAAS